MKPIHAIFYQAIVGTWLAFACASAAPMISIGPHVAIHMGAEVESKYMSNITMSVDNANARDDVILTLTPALELALFEESPHFDFRLGSKRDFLHFVQSDHFNEEPWSLNISTGYNGELFGLELHYDVIETLQNISTIAAGQTSQQHIKFDDDIVLDDIENMGFSFNIAFSPKTGMRSGFSLIKNDYRYVSGRPDELLDYDVMQIPVDFLYGITPKLESVFGYRFREVSFKGKVPEFKDHYINFGLVGDITAKSDLQLILGYQTRNRSGMKAQNSLAANLNWRYMTTERLHFHLGGSRDFDAGSSKADGAPSMQVSGINAGFDIFFTPSVVLDSSVRLMHSSYSSGRKDLGGNVGTMLVVSPRNSNWELQGAYRYDWNAFEAQNSTFDYKNHNVSLRTSWRY